MHRSGLDQKCTWPALNRFCTRCSCYNGPSFSVQVCGVGGEGVAGRGAPVQYEASSHHSCTGEGKGTRILALPGCSVAGEGGEGSGSR